MGMRSVGLGIPKWYMSFMEQSCSIRELTPLKHIHKRDSRNLARLICEILQVSLCYKVICVNARPVFDEWADEQKAANWLDFEMRRGFGHYWRSWNRSAVDCCVAGASNHSQPAGPNRTFCDRAGIL